jgi:hypothetical protein
MFWDLRTIDIFRRGVLPCRWEAIQSVEIYAMHYRVEDIDEATERKSHLQLEAWPLAVAALAALPHLRHLRVFMGNTLHLDPDCLQGRRRPTPYASTRGFLARLKELPMTPEILMPLKRTGWALERCPWNLHALEDTDRLRRELKDSGLDCSVSIWMSAEGQTEDEAAEV